MKIMKVNLKNFKVLEDFEQDLNGSSILLVGDNGIGKSTVLQGIKIALGSKDIPSTLQDGAKGIVEVDLSLIHISEPTRRTERSRMPSSA